MTQSKEGSEAGLTTLEASLPDPEPIISGSRDLNDHETAISAPPDQPSKRRAEPILQDQTNLLPFGKLVLVMIGLNMAALVAILDGTIVSTIIPVLGRQLGRADIASWVGSGYLLTSTAFLPLYGRLSDIFGRKSCLLAGLAIFLIGSILCATAKTMVNLIIFRALAGIGGGGIINMVFIILSDLVSLKDRGKYQGMLTAVQVLGASLGPIIGGAFGTKISWTWCFWINVPLCAFSIAAVVIFVPAPKMASDMRTKLLQIDYLGSALTLAWTVLVLIALQWGGVQYSWSSAATLAPLLIGIALLGIFILVEWKLVKLPIMPMRIFGNLSICSAQIATFLGAFILYGNLFYLPNFFQVVRGDTALRSGVLLLPTVLPNTLAVFAAGFIVSHTGQYRTITYAGFAVAAIGQGLLTTIDKDTSIAKIATYQVIGSIGNGLTPQTLLVAIQAAVDRKDMAVASAMRNFLRQLGGTIAITICSSIINNSLRAKLNVLGVDDSTITDIENDPTGLSMLGLSQAIYDEAIQGYTDGIRNVFYMTTACGILCFLVILFGLKAYPLVRKDDAQRKAEAKLAIKIKQDEKDGTVDVEALPPAEQGEELQGASGGIRKT